MLPEYPRSRGPRKMVGTARVWYSLVERFAAQPAPEEDPGGLTGG